MKISCAFLFVLSLFASIQQATAFCFKEAAEQYAAYGVTPELLYSIAKRESNFNNRAVHINVVLKGKNKGKKSRDVSMMQINERWFPILAEYGITEKNLMEEPCLSVKVGAWILAQSFSMYGIPKPTDPLFWVAVGQYNAGPSPDSHNARMIYAHHIYRNMVAIR